MHAFWRCFVLTLIFIKSINASAETAVFSSKADAISSLFPNKELFEWTSTEGDWNGDDVEDLAVILTNSRVDGHNENYLVVLAGVPNGKYSPLSVSSEYCDAQKWYSLEAKGADLFVAEIHKADADAVISNTLQFRFNKKLVDLELIGTENITESFQDNSYSSYSVNYTNGTAIEYERRDGLTKETKKTNFSPSTLARLNGFECNKYFDNTRY